ncbi:MAG: hypothetical protein IJZ07_07765 [Clostridia bacterium]|nr:hypothetical protein [Clostridia bacterium]
MGCNNNWCLFIILILLFCNGDCGNNSCGCGCGVTARSNDCGCGCGC